MLTFELGLPVFHIGGFHCHAIKNNNGNLFFKPIFFFNFNVKFELSSHYNKQEEQYKVLTITARKVLYY